MLGILVGGGADEGLYKVVDIDEIFGLGAVSVDDHPPLKIFFKLFEAHFNIAQNFSKKSSTDILAGMDRYSDCSAIFMFQPRMTSFLADKLKTCFFKTSCDV